MARIKVNGKSYYQIEEEDDYFKIGKKLYGQVSAAPLIAQANPDFEFLKTGAVIDLPEDVPEKIMIPYQKQNKDAVIRERHLDRETIVEEAPGDMDVPNLVERDAYEPLEEFGPEVELEPVENEALPAEVVEPLEIANNEEVAVEETVPEPATELAPEVEGLPEMAAHESVEEFGPDDEVDLPPTPEDAGENPEVNKDWETIEVDKYGDYDIVNSILYSDSKIDILKIPAIIKPRSSILPDSKDVTDWTIGQLIRNLNLPVTQTLKKEIADSFDDSLDIDKFKRTLAVWIAMVKTHAVWDLKDDLINGFDENLNINLVDEPLVDFGGQEIHFQAIVNLHYGFIGNVIGYPKILLEAGAGLAQAVEYGGRENVPEDAVGPFATLDYESFNEIQDSPNISKEQKLGVLLGSTDITFFDQPYDNYWVEMGFWLYDQTSESEELTAQTLEQYLDQYIELYGPPPEEPK